MANKEQHSGRMLFTDFDASDKGRPIAVLLEEPPAPAPVLTLDDIAAQLGLDFEDDGEGAPQSAPAPAPAPAPISAPAPASRSVAVPAPAPDAASVSVPQQSREDDGDLLLTDAADSIQLPNFHTAVHAADAAGVHTWDSLASAYERARPVEKLFLPQARTPDMPGASDAPGASGDDEAVDVLSMLDTWMERQTRVVAKKERGEEARPLPYGGVERVDDWFAPPENYKDPFERVEDWYAPPEDQPEAEELRRVDNWFEPPEAAAPAAAASPEASAAAEAGVDISWLSDFKNELPAGDYWRKKTTRIFRKDLPAAADSGSAVGAAAAEPAAHSPAAAETAELFAGVDIDRIWEQKVAEKQRPEGASSGKAAGTRSIDLFDALDVESLWEEKQRGQGDKPKADQTIIVKPGELEDLGAAGGLDAAGTVVVRKNLLSERLKPRPVPPPAPAPSSPAQSMGEESDDILAALEAPMPAPAASARLSQSASVPAPAPAPVVAERAAAGVDVAVVSDEFDGTETKSFAEADSDVGIGSEDDDAFDLDALVEEAADMDFDGVGGGKGVNVFGDGSPSAAAADGEEREYVARTPPAGAGRKNLTTDDLLDDIDMESFEGEAGDVSVPVIDDSAIDRIPHPGAASPDTAAEGADGAAAADAAPPAEEVAVNPMDVFADMDNMDFSDDVDDDMRAILDDEEADLEEEDGATEDAQNAAGRIAEEPEVIPTTRLGLLRYNAAKFLKRVLPMAFIDKLSAMVAWRENWWFYCDLAAAVLASASLAVIISYFFWYRGV